MNPGTIEVILYIIVLVSKYGPVAVDIITEFIQSLDSDVEVTLDMIKELKIPEGEFIPVSEGEGAPA
jgi:hypothetical protein